jgi:hypothetical protein
MGDLGRLRRPIQQHGGFQGEQKIVYIQVFYFEKRYNSAFCVSFLLFNKNRFLKTLTKVAEGDYASPQI